MKLKDLGRAIDFNGQVIPAVNIQVEDIPVGYMTYFEIMFENGSLWVISEFGPDFIEVEMYPRWAFHDMTYSVIVIRNWEEFVEVYNGI